MEPSAQANEVNADQTQANEPAEQPNQQQAAGIQKRIDELTAKIHAQSEAMAKKDEQMLEMSSRMMEIAAKSDHPAPAKPQEPELPEGADPAIAAYFDRRLAAMEARMASHLQMVAAVPARLEAQQHGASYANMVGDTSGWIANRAAAIAAGGAYKGVPINAQDAARFAMAEFIEAKAKAPNSNGRFMPPVAPQPSGGPQQNFQPQQQVKALPQNFEHLSPDQQMKILRERGVEDSPL